MSQIDFSKVPERELWVNISKSVGLFQLREGQASESMEKDFGASRSLAQPFGVYLATQESFVLGWGYHCTVAVLLDKYPELVDKMPTPIEVVQRAKKLLTEGEGE